MKKITNFLLVLVFFIATSAIYGQTKLTGTVLDETKTPLPGASVVVKGTTKGTTTDFDGNFTLTVDVTTGSLEVSFVGYEKTTLPFKGSKNFGKVFLNPSSETLSEIVITQASFAIERKTPVAVSTIPASLIENKLGTQEFPEILKATPGVYATKTGGGYGDSRINLRGFESNNIAVMINGVPVNDMENGRVYWSNWAGLSDVTSAMQVQRGLGASKVAVPSIGGTINIVSKSTDVVSGGNVTMSVANDGYQKVGATLSTGLMDNGFAATVSAAKISGDGYVDGTQFEGVNYFVNISKNINDNHKVSFSAFGAQQTHGQRFNRRTIEQYKLTESGGQKFNPDWGIYRGQVEYASYNFYHKPQMSLNHYWTINDNTNVSTSVYASFGSGGGRRTSGTKFADDSYRLGASDQPIDFDKIALENKNNGALGSTDILYNSMNNHKWYGVLSTLKTNINENLTFSGGLDGRYYVGSHWYEVDNLLGGQYFKNSSSDINKNKPLYVGDHFDKDYDGKVLWAGVFGQLEYTYNDLSAFVSSAVSNTTYSKVDFARYQPTDPKRESEKADFLGYSIKGGANYNLDANHNVFANVGYFSKAPFLTSNVFLSDRSTDLNAEALNEKVFSAELGYGFKSEKLSANLNIYRTSWLDKSLTGSIPDPDNASARLNYNIPGLDALHQGVELDFVYHILKDLTMTGMVSVGDWKWKNDASGQFFNELGDLSRTVAVYAKDLKVTDAAQTTFAAGLKYKALDKTSFYVDYNYAGDLYAFYYITDRSKPENRENSWKLPAYGLVDIGLTHGFNIGSFDATLNAKMNNILNTEYVSDANDGPTSDYDTATVYYGAGRTFSLGLKIKF